MKPEVPTTVQDMQLLDLILQRLSTCPRFLTLEVEGVFFLGVRHDRVEKP